MANLVLTNASASSVFGINAVDSGPAYNRGGSITPPWMNHGFPRIITALQLAEASDDDSIHHGPLSEQGDKVGLSEVIALEVLGVSKDMQARGIGKPKAAPGPGGGGRQKVPLVLPKGEVPCENAKYVCVFHVGLEDDEEFCLVKRILGKGGNNMRRIAEECNAKVRLRGIGSGFLEGTDGREANMPLQLNVRCNDYENYIKATDRVAVLLKDLYKHFRRYCRSKNSDVLDVKVNVEEVRRDDHSLEVVTQKAQKKGRAMRAERRQVQKDARDEDEDEAKAGSDDFSDQGPKVQNEAVKELKGEEQEDSSFVAARKVPLLLPDGQPMPTTAAGRREAARTGGAAATAAATAAARETDRIERDAGRAEREALRTERKRQLEKEREEKERIRREIEERAAAVAGRHGRVAPRGKNPMGSSSSAAAEGMAAPAAAWSKGGGKGFGIEGCGLGAGVVAVSVQVAPPPPPPAIDRPAALVQVLPDEAGKGSAGNEDVGRRRGRAGVRSSVQGA